MTVVAKIVAEFTCFEQESRAPLGPKSPESLKRSSQALRPGVSKVPTKSPRTRKRDENVSISMFRGSFNTFFDTPGRKAWEDLFATFWGFRGSRVWRLLCMGIVIAEFKGDSVSVLRDFR